MKIERRTTIILAPGNPPLFQIYSSTPDLGGATLIMGRFFSLFVVSKERHGTILCHSSIGKRSNLRPVMVLGWYDLGLEYEVRSLDTLYLQSTNSMGLKLYRRIRLIMLYELKLLN